MLATLNRIVKKDFVKVFSLTAVSTLVKMLTGFVSVKIVASLIGPTGVALLGQLNNFAAIFMTVSTGGINNGVTKYVAQYSKSTKRVSQFLQSAFWITALMSVIAGLTLILGARYFSELILHDVSYYSIIIVFGCTIILYSFNSLLLSILNGYKQFKKYIIINIISSIVGLLFSCVLAVILHIYGALLSAVTFQSIVFIVTLCMVSKNEWIRNLDFLRGFNVAAGRKLLNYSSMALVSAATVPVSQLMIRSSIVKYTSLYDAGLWEGMNRISSMYLYVITSSLSVYYLPRMSEIKKKNELRTEIINAYKLIIPPLILMTMAIYLSRNFIIHILFNDKFVGMEKLFAYQLIGDFFKISSWVLAYNMLAKSMTLTYTITEIIGTISYVALSIVTIRAFGNVGATMAYAICCVTYFTTMVVIFRKLVFANFYAK